MSITSTVTKIVATGDGNNTSWPFPFYVLDASDIHVYLTDTTKFTYEIETGWEANPTDLQYPTVGGTVTYPVSGDALPADWLITIARELPLTQETPYRNNSNLNPSAIEKSLDRTTMQIQQLNERLNRTFTYDISDTSSEVDLRSLYELETTVTNNAASAAAAATSASLAANSANELYFTIQTTLTQNANDALQAAVAANASSLNAANSASLAQNAAVSAADSATTAATAAASVVVVAEIANQAIAAAADATNAANTAAIAVSTIGASVTNANNSATAAETSAANAANSATQAAESAASIGDSVATCANSAIAAMESASEAANSATDAAASALAASIGGSGSGFIDGGNAFSVYTANQIINGGGAIG